MRNGKMMEARRQTLIYLLNELRSPRDALEICNFYRLGYWFRNENEADNFRKLLVFKLGFSGVRIESHTTYHRTPGCVVYVTWHVPEQEDLIKNIERYLQEDNMGPTNINRENTKFYAIVEDAEGKKTAYEIQHPSLETRMECCFGESSVTHRVEFDQDYMRECECVLTRWAKLSDEVEKLRAENEKLRATKDALAEHLGRCEDQLRLACEYLNGYDDIHVDIPTELKDLSYFNKAVNYTIEGKIKRREFGKKVADKVRKRADVYGVWRDPKNVGMIEEDNKILNDAVELAINPYYISCDTVKADRIKPYFLPNSAFDAATLRKAWTQLNLNSIYGITAAGTDEKPTKERLRRALEWSSYGGTTRHMNVNIYDSIKDVKFAKPATIVFWNDGTKTVVKAQGDEQYVPEVGLAMCICKKVMGNTRDYYRVFKHWMKKVKED